MAGLRKTSREKTRGKEIPSTERKRYKRFDREVQDIGKAIGESAIKLGDGEAGFEQKKVTKYIALMFVKTSRLTLKVGYMSDYIEEAEDLAKKALASFDVTSDELHKREEALVALSKKTSGSIRRSCNDLAGGLKKLEASANFDRLERLATTLEKAADAVETLAKLDQEGKLGRIAALLK